MQFQSTPYILPLILSSVITGFVALYVWERRATASGGMALALLALAMRGMVAGICAGDRRRRPANQDILGQKSIYWHCYGAAFMDYFRLFVFNQRHPDDAPHCEPVIHRAVDHSDPCLYNRIHMVWSGKTSEFVQLAHFRHSRSLTVSGFGSTGSTPTFSFSWGQYLFFDHSIERKACFAGRTLSC